MQGTKQMTNLDRMMDQILQLLRMRGQPDNDGKLDTLIRSIISDNMMKEPFGLTALFQPIKN